MKEEYDSPNRSTARPIMVILLTVLLMYSSATTASAWNEPDGFEEFRWGTSERAMKNHMEMLYCTENEKVKGYRACQAKRMLVGVNTQATFFFRFGGLVKVLLSFDPKDFGLMKEAMLDHYGPASFEVPTMISWGGRITNIRLFDAKDRTDPAIVIFKSTTEGEVPPW